MLRPRWQILAGALLVLAASDGLLEPQDSRRATPRPRWVDSKLDAAAEAGLRWLARHQDKDGSWSPESFSKHCTGTLRCEGIGYAEHVVGVTGLAVLAYLGAGHDDRSERTLGDDPGREPVLVGKVVGRALRWLRLQQAPGGAFCSEQMKWGYNQSIATLAMVEAYRASDSPEWKESARKGLQNLVAGQSLAPKSNDLRGWRYDFKSRESDISVVGWCVQALAAARRAGMEVPPRALQGAYDFCEEVTDRATGHVGYTKREEAGLQVKAVGMNDQHLNHPTLAAIGLGVRFATLYDFKDSLLERSAKLLADDMPSWDSTRKGNDYYYWHYGTLTLRRFDGPESTRTKKGAYWKAWGAEMRKALGAGQARNAKLCGDGSWDSDDRWGFEGGRVYATALNTSTLAALGR
jgi:hypothetical protein